MMSVVTGSPVHSSSSDDLAAFLDAELNSNSFASTPDEESKFDEAKTEDDDEHEDKRVKRCKMEMSDSIQEQICTHPGSFGDMCILCGQRLEEESGVTVGVSSQDMKSLLHRRKRYLLLDLDLDHTLLNSTLLAHLTPEEEYLKSQADSVQDVSKGNLFVLEFMHLMTKLRPFVLTFLKEASEMF